MSSKQAVVLAETRAYRGPQGARIVLGSCRGQLQWQGDAGGLL